MKIIKINPKDYTVTHVEYNGDYHELYKLLECSVFELAGYVRDQEHSCDALYVDEEGLLNDAENRIGVFYYRGLRQAYVGHGLIVGINPAGDDIDTGLTLAEASANVVFGTLEMRSDGVYFMPHGEVSDGVLIR